ncbi:MAG: hypothetical protein H7Z42_13625 [Roseiflexaceae bacterium]|nr:hypothetical protein [Roseiflexaceae bacterium]
MTSALAACGSALANSVPAVTAKQSMPVPADLRDFRYCEIIPVFRERATLSVEVYNTISLNDCPADLWAKLGADAMAKQYGTQQISRHWARVLADDTQLKADSLAYVINDDLYNSYQRVTP